MTSTGLERKVITEQDDDSVKAAQFQQWLGHPITQLMCKALEQHFKDYLNDALLKSSDFSLPHEQIRQHVAKSKTVRSCLELVQNYEAMKKKVTK